MFDSLARHAGRRTRRFQSFIKMLPSVARRGEPALILVTLMMLLGATGCTELSVGVSRGTPLPRFLALSRSSIAQVYRLSPGDQLTARFYFNPQLDEDVQ